MEIIAIAPQFAPIRSSDGAAGYDCRAAIDAAVTVHPNTSYAVPLGFKLHIDDPGLVALLFARSGLATRHGLVLRNAVGVIDSDYQGNCVAVVQNTGPTAIKICPGDRICQMVFVHVAHPAFELVTTFTAQTERHANGFGSTGVA